MTFKQYLALLHLVRARINPQLNCRSIIQQHKVKAKVQLAALQKALRK